MIDQAYRKRIWLFMLKMILLCVNTGAFTFCWHRCYEGQLYLHFEGNGNLMVIGLFGLLHALFSRLYGGFALTTSRSAELVYSHAVALIMTHGVMYIVTWLLVRNHLPRVWPMALCFIICSLVAGFWSYIANQATDYLIPPKKTVIIYDNKKAFQNAVGITQKYKNRFNVIDIISVNDAPEDMAQKIERDKPEALLICGVNSSQRNDLIKYCIEHSIAAYIRPNIGDFLISNAKVLHMNNLPVYLCQRACPSIFYLFLKRLFDIVLSVIGLIVTSPILLIAAIAIKVYDGGPVLFTQERMTIDRKVFRIHKLRSMQVDADKDGKGIVTLKNDDRITPVGKVMRVCRIDELTQLYDILIGNMSIVGPRPERLETIKLYEREMPEFALRLQVKAGLTGYAQVYGKANTSPYDKLQMDLFYISQQSFVTDIKIILATIKILFVPESTEGFGKEMESCPYEEEDMGIIATEMPTR